MPAGWMGARLMDGIVRALAGHPGTRHHRHGDGRCRWAADGGGPARLQRRDARLAVSVLLISGRAALVSRMLAGTGTFRPSKAWCNRTLTQLLPETSQGRAAQADAAATGSMSFYRLIEGDVEIAGRGRPGCQGWRTT